MSLHGHSVGIPHQSDNREPALALRGWLDLWHSFPMFIKLNSKCVETLGKSNATLKLDSNCVTLKAAGSKVGRGGDFAGGGE